MTIAPTLRVAFMGTPDFAVVALDALHQAGHTIVAVYCQPPKPAGRGHQVQKTPVHHKAEELGLPVYTPISLRDPSEQKRFATLDLDVAVVAAYGLILPQAILDAPRQGCINIHGSLLPRWRGAAPIQRAILAGDTQSGITIMQMDAGLDTGAILLHDRVQITSQTTAQSLHDDLAIMGGKLIIQTLSDLIGGKLNPIPQTSEKATYAAKLTREDGRIDWNKPAEEIDCQLRALVPWPGCSFMINGETLKVIRAQIIDTPSSPAGTLLDDQFTVACETKALRLISVQRAGKAATDGASLLRGLRLPIGLRL